jgi:tetratricopeptide (TPR) repeat protein
VDDVYERLIHVKYRDGNLCVDGLRNEELVFIVLSAVLAVVELCAFPRCQTTTAMAEELFGKADGSDMTLQAQYDMLLSVVTDDAAMAANAGAQWRLGRAGYNVANEQADKSSKQPYVERALQAAEAAVKLEDGNGQAHKWNGILLGSKGNFLPTKEKIANAYVIRDHFTKAAECMPNDATAHHCLGVWCWQILQIGYIERAAAAVIFGTPPSSTYEDCEKSLLKCAELNAEHVQNNLMLGDLYYYQKKWMDAKKWFLAAAALPAESVNEKSMQAEAAGKAKKCG